VPVASRSIAVAVVAAALAAGGAVGCGGGGSGMRAGAVSALPAAPSSATCDRVAAPRAGARRHTVGALLRVLRPGQVGCLRRGTYREDVAIGVSGIVLRSYPGERARIVGRLWVRRTARGDRFEDLDLDGRNARELPSPTVNGDGATFAGVDVTNRHTAVCFLLGSSRYGRARDTVIERSRIHGCGRLPSNNREHGIYISQAEDTRILDNIIYDNADRGIQLYPDAQRTIVRGNIIDGNGEGLIFSGDGRHASSHNVVSYNVITASRIRANVESWYPTLLPRAVGNLVGHNCVWGGRPVPIDRRAGGFTVVANVVADPGFRGRRRGDFRLRPGSPCAALMAGSRAPAGPQGQPPDAG
jgi:parallel beta-helix repeat protein